MIKAVIFDMDGLLIDSEPLWQEAEIEEFQKVGVKLTKELCMQTMGLRLDEVVKHWHSQYPWNNLSLEEVEKNVITKLTTLIKDKGQPLPGVFATINLLVDLKMPIAIASSSPLNLIHAVAEKFNIKHLFHTIHSAEFEKKGKPDPAIFISTAKFLSVTAESCLVFEDSYNGLLAAKNAGMKTVCVPNQDYYTNKKFDIADLKINSLEDFTLEHLNQFNREI
ncbi:MAG: hexitol phosphatase HxpB [Bacteroidetes bacterium]|nr:hexitol phosphatase HxpB [Bacteroidota bacterium]